jgi:hypothetical protein
VSQPGRAQQEIARVPVAPAAVIYGKGWQSWSVTAGQPVTTVPHRVTAPRWSNPPRRRAHAPARLAGAHGVEA